MSWMLGLPRIGALSWQWRSTYPKPSTGSSTPSCSLSYMILVCQWVCALRMLRSYLTGRTMRVHLIDAVSLVHELWGPHKVAFLQSSFLMLITIGSSISTSLPSPRSCGLTSLTMLFSKMQGYSNMWLSPWLPKRATTWLLISQDML